MIGLSLYGVAIKTVILFMFGSVLPQTPAEPPLTVQQVRSRFNYEKGRGAGYKDATKHEVEQRGVDFLLDPETEREFRTLGMNPDLVDAIRKHAKIARLTIQCEPVECEVMVNDEVAGTTFGSHLTKSPVKPGLARIKVSAPSFVPQTKEVQVALGEDVKVPKFVLVPVRGRLDVTCELETIPTPAVCEITVNGPSGPSGSVRNGETTQGRWTLPDLPSGEYEVKASAPLSFLPRFVPKTEKVLIAAPDTSPIRFKLEVDEWATMTNMQAFDAVVNSLGGKAILTVGSASKNTGRMRLAGDPPLWNAQVTEYVSRNRLRWDMTVAATKWNVVYDGAKVGSDGDKKKYSGTEVAQELEYAISLFSTMRLPSVLSLIRAKFDIDKVSKQVLTADSPDERFTFTLNADYLPLKVVHERKTPPRSQEEIEFAEYRSIGQDLRLPHVLILRYSDRKREHIFEYEKIDTSAPMKEDLFKVPK